LLRSARAVIEELDRAEKEIRDTNGNVNAERGLIRLSTECYTVYHWLPPRLKMFQQKFPSVEFQLVVEATDYPYESLLNGELDVAIVCNPPRNRRIRYTPLFEDEMVVIVSSEERQFPAKRSSDAGGNRAAENSGADADRGDHRSGARQPRGCGGGAMGGGATVGIGRGGRTAAYGRRVAPELGGGATARQIDATLCGRVRQSAGSTSVDGVCA
jgi:DNA-binding transcriptional LysR family regulator